MNDPRQDQRIRHGLIPVLVAIRAAAERKRKAADAAKTAGAELGQTPKKKRGWFG